MSVRFSRKSSFEGCVPLRLTEPQRPLVLYLICPDRPMPVPKIKNGSDHNANAHAAEKEPAVSRQPEQQGEDQGRRNHQTGSAAQVASGGFGLRIPVHTNTLPAFYLKG